MKYPILLLIAAVFCAGCNKQALSTSQHKVVPTIVILGSSTAAGNGATPPDSAWANRVQASVNKSGIKANFVNLAVAGYTTYQAMPTGYYAVYKPTPDTGRNVNKAIAYKPALVILNFPSNDIAEGYTDTEILNNYAAITHKLDSAKVQYIIFSTQPRDFPDPNQRMRLKTINDKVIAVYTFHVNDFLDQLSTSTYSINPLYSEGDGIHINNAGHAIIAKATLKHPIFVSVVN
jgi:lysophospholipase L1-like esterase